MCVQEGCGPQGLVACSVNPAFASPSVVNNFPLLTCWISYSVICVSVWLSGHLKLIHLVLTVAERVNWWETPFIKGVCWPLTAVSWSPLHSEPENTRHQTAGIVGGIKDNLLIQRSSWGEEGRTGPRLCLTSASNWKAQMNYPGDPKW